MTTFRRYWIAIFLTAANFAVVAWFYHRLPAHIPVHWNMHGVVNGWMPKERGALTIPFLAVGVLALLIALAPRISVAGSLQRIYPHIVAAIAAFQLYTTTMLMLAGAGLGVDVSAASSIGLGILIMIVGNSLGKVTRNSRVGIRTPWTLANDEVWSRTQRVGGWLLVLAGLASAIAGLLGHGQIFVIVAVLAAALISVVYSFVISRRVQ